MFDFDYFYLLAGKERKSKSPVKQLTIKRQYLAQNLYRKTHKYCSKGYIYCFK